MQAREIKSQLKRHIITQLEPLINHNYWLLEVPYYTNIGDGLIWQGELDFLKTLPHKCKGMFSYNSGVPQNISQEDIILLQGGGNFGDIWPLPQDYRMRVTKMYPNNKIIIFPQTVWFENEDNLKECAKQYSNCSDLTICARDKKSYDTLKHYFTNNILLMPDMAFCIDMSKWKSYTPTKEALFIRREDKELKMTDELALLGTSKEITITDWPTFTEQCWQKTWFRRTRKYLPVLYDWYAHYIFRPYLIDSGIKLISSYNKIFSTRLHAAILCILLNKAKELTWFDNSYGKNLDFYETWLKDCEGIKFVK